MMMNILIHLNLLQLVFPKFLFYTEEDNIWFEFNDHPMTVKK